MEAQRFIERFNQYCPEWLAEPGDPVGLHIGTLNKPAKRIMMSLDVRPNVVAEAIEKKIDLLVVKHPPIFRPIDRLVTDDVQINMYADLIKHDIAVYAAHTNMDIIPNGLNDWFCELLGVQKTTYLVKSHQVVMKKLAVFVPMEEAGRMREALAMAGAGQQGNYRATSYTLGGTGRFTPVRGANPTIGEIGKAQQVQENKIEVIFPETMEEKILSAMYQAHPYEEPAFDLYQLDNLPTKYGIGRIGELDEPMETEAFIQKVKSAFQLEGLRVIYPKQKKSLIRTVAICGGSAEKFYRDAVNQEADVYITGDVYYHTAHDMQETGMLVIDPGHYIEEVCKKKMVEQFNLWKNEEGWDVEFVVSASSTNPFSFK
ncbi:GTP cyclohydrolase 1 type 2 [Enterococcus florum]|uniref:GTP cyclohydrolase 1 type 2 homolog n=1 Tax=Enterococcus florum TaxID=2480627 RepID=A0A4P5PA71_9ENTE|nr:Nif3-like dinuclear metal center hexameric protein [Enterococcus florum]GCF94526.1 GTP cyclohydrolase 1 type 2 [Enterococcus florum]